MCYSYLHVVLLVSTHYFDNISALAFQSEHDGSDVQIELNVEHCRGKDIVPNMTKSPKVKYITFYEDSESIPGKRTAVWELDKGGWLVLAVFTFRILIMLFLDLTQFQLNQHAT